MCIFFNPTKDVDASANETYLIQNKSPPSCAYTSNVIPIKSTGHMNKTSQIRFLDTSTWYLEQGRLPLLPLSDESNSFPYYC